jgi:protein-disulfide isomerase
MPGKSVKLVGRKPTVIRLLNRLIAPQRMIGLLLIMAWLMVNSRGLVAQAAEINPQLKEQVLQIIRENPEVVLEAVQAYRKKQEGEQQKARQSFLQQMVANPQTVIGRSPTTGAKNGKILLVEFSDFQCPYCSKAQEPLKQFLAKHGDSVTLVYKNLPLTSIHPEALPAAKAAWAAGQQGKFWEFHTALFNNQKQLGEAFYQVTAKSLGLNLAQFDRDRTSPTAETAIAQDLQMAEQLGIDGTPFFVMNGQPLPGVVQLSDLEKALEKAKKGS